MDRAGAALALNACALASKAKIAVLPVQDVMGLDGSARMNTPSTSGDNWKFRLKAFPPRKDLAVLRKMIAEFRR